MPSLRDLVRVSQTPTLTTFHDPPAFTDLDVLVTTADASSPASGVTISGASLTLANSSPTSVKFTGDAGGFKWQIDVIGVGSAMAARATSRPL